MQREIVNILVDLLVDVMWLMPPGHTVVGCYAVLVFRRVW